MRELELQVNYLRITEENEGFIERSFSEVVTSKIQAERGWVTNQQNN